MGEVLYLVITAPDCTSMEALISAPMSLMHQSQMLDNAIPLMDLEAHLFYQTCMNVVPGDESEEILSLIKSSLHLVNLVVLLAIELHIKIIF